MSDNKSMRIKYEKLDPDSPITKRMKYLNELSGEHITIGSYIYDDLNNRLFIKNEDGSLTYRNPEQYRCFEGDELKE